MRLKILKQTESEPEALDNLTKLNNAKVPLDVLENAQDAAEYGAGMMIKFDKNREKETFIFADLKGVVTTQWSSQIKLCFECFQKHFLRNFLTDGIPKQM